MQGNLWKAHLQVKKKLLEEVENRTGVALDLDALTIGFARRAAAYKRSGLIFHRPHIIEPLLEDRTIQLVFSGKAHPADDWGKQIVANIAEMAYRFPDSVVFLENYNMGLARLLTAGCDVWLNTPQRPLEASGTSGMKAALNGVLNLSVLDGWWPEGCLHGVTGWQFGGGYEGPEQTMVDALSLYEVLLEEVIPTFYEDRGALAGDDAGQHFHGHAPLFHQAHAHPVLQSHVPAVHLAAEDQARCADCPGHPVGACFPFAPCVILEQKEGAQMTTPTMRS